jgi:hypothetical protein
VSDVTPSEPGVNIGSTPFVGDLNGDNLIDILYAYRADSTNPMGWKGMYLKRLSTGILKPTSGIAWGSYMGTNYNGEHTSSLMDCGQGSVISYLAAVNPTCNGLTNGYIIPNLSATATPPFTYLWSNGSVDSVLANAGAGTYSVTVIDSSGCFETLSATLSDPYTITFGGLIPPTCEGGSNAQVTVSSSGCYCMFSGCTFLWNTGTTGYTASNLSAGTYSVTITHNNGCVVVASVTIPDGTPVVSTSNVTSVSCFGMNDGSISITPSFPSSATINWSTGATTDSIGGLTAGTYSVIVSDARPCFDTLQFAITQPPALTLSMSSIPETSTGTQNGIAVVTTNGGTPPYSFIWNDPLSQTDSIANGLSSGVYTVMVSDNNGCIISDSVLVDITTGLNATNSTESFTIFPNPSVGNNSILISGNIQHCKLELLDYNGKLVRTHQLVNESSFRIERLNLPDGLYFCKISSNDSVKIISIIWN